MNLSLKGACSSVLYPVRLPLASRRQKETALEGSCSKEGYIVILKISCNSPVQTSEQQHTIREGQNPLR